VTSGGPLRIGGTAIWPEFFKGSIDEVRVYDRALERDRPRPGRRHRSGGGAAEDEDLARRKAAPGTRWL
jgi:Concanavalin A-like lectin/glucanases superfamily